MTPDASARRRSSPTPGNHDLTSLRLLAAVRHDQPGHLPLQGLGHAGVAASRTACSAATTRSRNSASLRLRTRPSTKTCWTARRCWRSAETLGVITGDSVFFERFYGGGIGSLRGFKFRQVSPRSGIDLDPVGGDFIATGTVELNFPVIGEGLRAVVFTDFGDVEPSVRITHGPQPASGPASA